VSTPTHLTRAISVIAHVDHGKTTLSDRLLEYTGTVAPRDMVEQVLDQLDLERERGITIKAQAVRMLYKANDGNTYQINLIDTPGHVDFSYEVSRALAACDGAILVVDASQGIEAQTLANVHQALDHHLKIIPVVNKIDLQQANPELVREEIEKVIGLPAESVIFASARQGIGTKEILEAVVREVPPPTGDSNAPLQALIFDAKFDAYRGVVTYIRVLEGTLRRGMRIQMMQTGKSFEVDEVGIFRPEREPVDDLSAGEVGYLIANIRNVRDSRVGDTVTDEARPAAAPLPGYRHVTPMVFAGLFPTDTEQYQQLKDALEHAATFFTAWPAPAGLRLRLPGYNADSAEGVSYTMDLAQPVGSRIRDLAFRGAPLDPAQKLRVAINNYRYTGGGGYSVYKGLPALYRSSQEIRDLLIEYLTRTKKIPSRSGDNWKIVPPDALAAILAAAREDAADAAR